MELHSFFWHLVFEYLGPQDLVSMASVCLIWWEIVFRRRKAIAQTFLECRDLTLANTGRLYQLLPLKLLSGLHRINLSGTSISSQHFLQLVSTARRLRELNTQCCAEIGEQAIFKAKSSLRLLRRINISQNGQFSILVIACLCSIDALEEITARGISLEYREILFLLNTFPRLGNGLDLETDTTDGALTFLTFWTLFRTLMI